MRTPTWSLLLVAAVGVVDAGAPGPAALTTVTPCPSAPSSKAPAPITVTSQYQPISTCEASATCFKGRCYTQYSYSTWDYVSTVIPCAFNSPSPVTTVTKTDQSVLVSRASTTITNTEITSSVITTKKWRKPTTVTSTATSYTTVIKEWSAPYKNLGALAIPDYKGCGICQSCTGPKGEDIQNLDVIECIQKPVGPVICHKLSEVWVYDDSPTSSSTASGVCSTRTAVPSAGTYVFKFPQRCGPATMDVPARTITWTKGGDRPSVVTTTVTASKTIIPGRDWTATVTRSCSGPTIIEFNIVVTKIIIFVIPPFKFPDGKPTNIPRPGGWGDWTKTSSPVPPTVTPTSSGSIGPNPASTTSSGYWSKSKSWSSYSTGTASYATLSSLSLSSLSSASYATLSSLSASSASQSGGPIPQSTTATASFETLSSLSLSSLTSASYATLSSLSASSASQSGGPIPQSTTATASFETLSSLSLSSLTSASYATLSSLSEASASMTTGTEASASSASLATLSSLSLSSLTSASYATLSSLSEASASMTTATEASASSASLATLSSLSESIASSASATSASATPTPPADGFILQIVASIAGKERRQVVVQEFFTFNADNTGAQTENRNEAAIFFSGGGGRLLSANGADVGSRSSEVDSAVIRSFSAINGFTQWSFPLGVAVLEGAAGFCIVDETIFAVLDISVCAEPVLLIQAPVPPPVSTSSSATATSATETSTSETSTTETMTTETSMTETETSTTETETSTTETETSTTETETSTTETETSTTETETSTTETETSTTETETSTTETETSTTEAETSTTETSISRSSASMTSAPETTSESSASASSASESSASASSISSFSASETTTETTTTTEETTTTTEETTTTTEETTTTTEETTTTTEETTTTTTTEETTTTTTTEETTTTTTTEEATTTEATTTTTEETTTTTEETTTVAAPTATTTGPPTPPSGVCDNPLFVASDDDFNYFTCAGVDQQGADLTLAFQPTDIPTCLALCTADILCAGFTKGQLDSDPCNFKTNVGSLSDNALFNVFFRVPI